MSLMATVAEAEILKVLSFYGIEHNKASLWGTGKPLREFLWSEDMADASSSRYLSTLTSPTSLVSRNTHQSITATKRMV